MGNRQANTAESSGYHIDAVFLQGHAARFGSSQQPLFEMFDIAGVVPIGHLEIR
ncbi:hypothetical protein D3C73_790860 [compost metagenome]